MSAEEAIQQLAKAYRAVTGRMPRQRTLSLLWAQWALETARGRKMWGFNFGGIKAGRGGARLVTRERVGNVTRSVGQHFRTYANASEGARDYILTLLVDFPSALAAAQSGSAERFVGHLHREGYFTGRPEDYARAVTLLAAECEDLLRARQLRSARGVLRT